MTRLEILEKKVDALYDNKAGIENRIEMLSNRMKREQKLILEKYIDTYDYFKVNYFDDRVSVYAKDSNYSLLDMYVYDEWNGDERLYNRIDFSTSSFRTEFGNSNMEWAEERFKMLAFYSKVLSDFSDDILAEFNTVKDKYSKLIKDLHELHTPIRKEIRELNEKLDRLKDEELMEKLMSENGLMIENKEDDNYLPKFQAKFDWELHSVKSIRGLKKSSSGKSIDLEVAVRRGYGEDKKLEVIKIDRVRFDNVKRFINRNSNSIV
jgi:hypothetical protein